MAPKRKTNKEEILLKKKLRERERYKKIKADPVKLEQQREKERKKYENKKKKKQVKSINEMNEREARLKRKEWRARSKKYYNKKKRIAQEISMLPESPPSTDASRPASPVQRNSGRKRIRRDRSKIIQRNKKLIQETARLKTLLEKYRKRCYRAEKATCKKNESEMTPRSKVKTIMKSKDKQLVRKRLLFGAALECQLKTNYENIDSSRMKKQFVNTMLGDGKIVKKCKITKELQHIFTKRLTRCNTNNYIKKRQHRLFKAQIQDDIKRFFNDHENTRLAPGKKDCKTLKKVKKQKRYINDTMLNLHKKFSSAVPYPISYSLFCKYRPFYVVYQKLDGRDTCQCKIHMNTDFIVSALYRNKVINARTPKEIAEELCCNSTYSVSCLLRSCSNCKDKQISFKEFNGDFHLQYFQWEIQKDCYMDKQGETREVKRTVKFKKTTPVIDLVHKLESIIHRFMKHEAIILNQFAQLKFLKMCMREDEVLIHFDFSENYCLKYGNEIQSFHFGGSRQQITLHTTAVQFKEANYAPVKTKSFCTLSKNLNHSATEVLAHLSPILKYVNLVKPQLTVLHFLSDGPSTQYRNKDMFYIFSHLIKEFFPHLEYSTYNYFEAGHGKGTPDGIGGTIKRTADRLVAEGKDIDSIDVLSTYLKENIRKIETHVITDGDIEAVRKKVNYAEVKPFKGTMKIHQVVQVHDNTSPIVLKMKSMSCFKCMENHRDKLKSFECNHFTIGSLKYSLEDEKFQKAGTSKYQTTEMHDFPDHTYDREETDAEMENDGNIPKAGTSKYQTTQMHNFSDHTYDREETDAEIENDGNIPNRPNQVSWENLKPGKFILVEFLSEKKTTKYRYVCSVQTKDDDDGEVTVQGLKLANKSGSEFFVADEHDVSFVQFESILKILKDPKIVLKNRHIVYKFPEKINVYEKN